MTIQQFVVEYGFKTPTLLIAMFIARAPRFEGDTELAAQLGRMVADLESALEEVLNNP
jgi:hypothetical protein